MGHDGLRIFCEDRSLWTALTVTTFIADSPLAFPSYMEEKSKIY